MKARFYLIPMALLALERVYATLHTALLTNNLAPMDRNGDLARALLPHVDVAIESAVIGVRKPDTAFFRVGLRRAQGRTGRLRFPR